jgi:hypothetical protein
MPQVAGVDSAVGRQLGRPVRMQVSTSRPRILQDEILPTQPVRLGEDDAIERLRDQYFQERQGRMPVSFRNPTMWNGFSMEVSAADAAAGGLGWQPGAGAKPETATVDGASAEIVWSGGSPPTDGRHVLCRGDGRQIGEIVADKGSLTIRVADDVRCRYWIAFDPAPADLAGTREGGSVRFEWRLLRSETLPDGIRRDDRWRNGRTQRIDLPLNFRDGAAQCSFSVALVDKVSGWAIETQVDEIAASAAAR